MNFAHSGAPRALPPFALFAFFSFASCPAFAQSPAPPPSHQPPVMSPAVVSRLPLSFEANQGQSDRRVQFLSRGRGYTLFLTPTEAVFSLYKNPGDPRMKRPTPRVETATLRMKLVGSNPHSQAAGREALPGQANYLIGKDPKGWQTRIPTYGKVRFPAVYPGVDLVYYGNQRHLEYDFVVAPGADPKSIGLQFTGAEHLRVDKSGDLILGIKGGEVRWQKPVLYQQAGGKKQPVAGRYVRRGKDQIGFEVAKYDTRRPLVIDPSLTYATYLGSGNDAGNGVAFDRAGNVYIVGSTGSVNFPTSPDAFQPAKSAGGINVFVAKLNPSATAVIYATYLGGDTGELGSGIAVGPTQNAYIVGTTFSGDFPTTGTGYRTSRSGNSDAFMSIVSSDGTALLYSTYFGGGADENGNGIALDKTNRVYITGSSNSTDLPVSSNAFQKTNRSTFVPPGSQGFVTKFDPTLSGTNALVYSTYLGGSTFDNSNAIAVDSTNNAYVTGFADSPDFPVTNGVFQPASSTQDAFVTEVGFDGSRLLYSTYLGGNGREEGFGIALDPGSIIYVTGSTSSSDFPTTQFAFQLNFGGGSGGFGLRGDAFVVKIDPSRLGTLALVYSTYLGGRGSDIGNAIAADQNGNAYITGSTASNNFPTTIDAVRRTFGGGNPNGGDAFVVKLHPKGSKLIYGTYLGGLGDDTGNGIAADANQNVYVTGNSRSNNFPTTPGVLKRTSMNGGGFVSKFNLKTIATTLFDFNGDGNPDILLRNMSTGDLNFWLMNDVPQVVGLGSIVLGIPTEWQLVGTPDFGGKGQEGLLWQNTRTGDVTFRYLNGTQQLDWVYIGVGVPTEWKIVSTLDISGDGKTDILWYNTRTGDVTYWLMDGINYVGWGYVAQSIPLQWKIVGTLDMDDDNNPDILWQNQQTGQVTWWKMDHAVWAGEYGSLTQTDFNPLLNTEINLNLKIVGTPDLNSDGRQDILMQDQTTGALSFWLLRLGSIVTKSVLSSGLPLDVKVTGIH